MSKHWPMVKLGQVVSDLTESRTFNVQPDDVIIDPTISSGTHEISAASTSRGFEVRVSKRTRIEPGDLVFSRLHTQNGAFAFSKERFQATGTFVPFCLNEEKVDRRFLYWALHKFVPSLSASDTVGRETYKTSDILGLEIPLPPLSEQRRVVMRIELLAAQIHQARTIRNQAAEEAGALVASSARKVLSGSWPQTRLEDVCPLITDGTHQTPRYTTEGAIFLSAKNVKPFRFMPKEHRKVSLEDFRAYTARNKPQLGDVLLTRVGAGIGEAAVVDQDIEFAIYVSLALIRTDSRRLLAEFLVHWLNSPAGRMSSSRETLGRGHSQGNLNLKLLRRVLLPIPPLPEQSRIVAELDILRGEVEEVKRLQAKTGSELDALMPSILSKAFRGQL